MSIIFKPKFRLSVADKQMVGVYANGVFLANAALYDKYNGQGFIVEEVGTGVFLMKPDEDGFRISTKRRQFFSRKLSKRIFEVFGSEKVKATRIYFEIDHTGVFNFVEAK
jgi:hypothetical protein